MLIILFVEIFMIQYSINMFLVIQYLNVIFSITAYLPGGNLAVSFGNFTDIKPRNCLSPGSHLVNYKCILILFNMIQY